MEAKKDQSREYHLSWYLYPLTVICYTKTDAAKHLFEFNEVEKEGREKLKAGKIGN